jgi:hypothetical protein
MKISVMAAKDVRLVTTMATKVGVVVAVVSSGTLGLVGAGVIIGGGEREGSM